MNNYTSEFNMGARAATTTSAATTELATAAERATFGEALAAALAAKKAIEAIEGFEEVWDDPTISSRYRNLLRGFFEGRGVAFGDDGAPLLPGGAVGAFEFEEVHGRAWRLLTNFLKLARETIALDFEQPLGEWLNHGWHFGLTRWFIGHEPDTFIVPVVIGVKLGEMTLVTDEGRVNKLPDSNERAVVLENLVKWQHPEMWAEWLEKRSVSPAA